jgi:hypothetical protein
MKFLIQIIVCCTTPIICLILSAIIWQFYFPEKIYDCTDNNLFGFFRPGSWVHGDYVTVPKIDPNDSMSKPDSIKEGWSVGKLWFVWWAFIVTSVVISASLPLLLFRPEKLKSAQSISS